MQAQEIFYIFIIALIVLGPQRMPGMARKLGKWAAEFRKAAGELRSGLEAEVGDLSEIRREVVAPLQEARKDLQAPLQDLKRDVNKPIFEMKAAAEGVSGGVAATVKPSNTAPKPLRWVGPVPEAGPTATEAEADLQAIEESGGPLTDEPEIRQMDPAAPDDQAEASA